jgi:hypothetical protein
MPVIKSLAIAAVIGLVVVVTAMWCIVNFVTPY